MNPRAGRDLESGAATQKPQQQRGRAEARDLQRPAGIESDAVVRVIRVPPEGSGQRLDVFLSEALRSTSRTRAKRIAERCAYFPDGHPRKASDRLRAEDQVVLWRSPVDDVDPGLSLPVLHSDPHLLVIDKPAHVAVHPTARHYHATVTKMLEGAYPNETLNLIHRLDRETSGVLMLARGPVADRAFKLLFEGIPPDRNADGPQTTRRRRARRPAHPVAKRRLVKKTYLAICWGRPDDGLIDAPVEPDPESPLRVKMRIARSGSGLAALTQIQCLAECEGYALVRCSLLTGRQHQIRLHLAHAGCPVVGDKLYGPDPSLLARAADGKLTRDDMHLLELPRHALHATRYQLEHAIVGTPLDLVAPLPPDLAEFWKSVSGRPAPVG